jgi:hypothetical protein
MAHLRQTSKRDNSRRERSSNVPRGSGLTLTVLVELFGFRFFRGSPAVSVHRRECFER